MLAPDRLAVAGGKVRSEMGALSVECLLKGKNRETAGPQK